MILAWASPFKLCLASATHNFKWLRIVHICSTWDLLFANRDFQTFISSQITLILPADKTVVFFRQWYEYVDEGWGGGVEQHPSKHVKFSHCWINAWPASWTMDHHWPVMAKCLVFVGMVHLSTPLSDCWQAILVLWCYVGIVHLSTPLSDCGLAILVLWCYVGIVHRSTPLSDHWLAILVLWCLNEQTITKLCHYIILSTYIHYWHVWQTNYIYNQKWQQTWAYIQSSSSRGYSQAQLSRLYLLSHHSTYLMKTHPCLSTISCLFQ